MQLHRAEIAGTLSLPLMQLVTGSKNNRVLWSIFSFFFFLSYNLLAEIWARDGAVSCSLLMVQSPVSEPTCRHQYQVHFQWMRHMSCCKVWMKSILFNLFRVGMWQRWFFNYSFLFLLHLSHISFVLIGVCRVTSRKHQRHSLNCNPRLLWLHADFYFK